MTDSWWTRWPDPDAGPLWVGLHVKAEDGVEAVVGVELWTVPPGVNRPLPGPLAGVVGTDPYPHAPTAVRTADLRALGLTALLKRRAAEIGQEPVLAGFPGYTPDHWRRVAQLAQATLARGDRRTALAVATTWSVSRHTAKKWLVRCRSMGLL